MTSASVWGVTVVGDAPNTDNNGLPIKAAGEWQLYRAAILALDVLLLALFLLQLLVERRVRANRSFWDRVKQSSTRMKAAKSASSVQLSNRTTVAASRSDVQLSTLNVVVDSGDGDGDGDGDGGRGLLPSPDNKNGNGALRASSSRHGAAAATPSTRTARNGGRQGSGSSDASQDNDKKLSRSEELRAKVKRRMRVGSIPYWQHRLGVLTCLLSIALDLDHVMIFRIYNAYGPIVFLSHNVTSVLVAAVLLASYGVLQVRFRIVMNEVPRFYYHTFITMAVLTQICSNATAIVQIVGTPRQYHTAIYLEWLAFLEAFIYVLCAMALRQLQRATRFLIDGNLAADDTTEKQLQKAVKRLAMLLYVLGPILALCIFVQLLIAVDTSNSEPINVYSQIKDGFNLNAIIFRPLQMAVLCVVLWYGWMPLVILSPFGSRPGVVSEEFRQWVYRAHGIPADASVDDTSSI
eukprot:TRINITY_DN84813_c0_g1_i1.p1 TRINITY_DN84813_c0_g1~~TRINITY_DN84813_c0_g1_i1.p1  ORF type:complete len:464 (+),score=195.40 TRINITY_DN84813_c0_g1_i1:53-1444(+)